VKFCPLVANLYPHMLANSSKFIFVGLFIKMPLIFQQKLIVFTISSLEFHQVTLLWLSPRMSGPQFTRS